MTVSADTLSADLVGRLAAAGKVLIKRAPHQGGHSTVVQPGGGEAADQVCAEGVRADGHTVTAEVVDSCWKSRATVVPSSRGAAAATR